jgi:AraC-like DNA-binding protein
MDKTWSHSRRNRAHALYKLGHCFNILGNRIGSAMPPLARSQILTGYAPLARSLGLSPERFVSLVGLDLSMQNELDSRISARAFAELLERSAEAAKVEDFGLRLAESRDVGILGPVGIVIHQEPDLRSALRSLVRYLPVHNESLALRLEDERGIAVLSLEVRSSGLEDVRQVTELSLGAFFRILCRLAGPHWKPHRICFEHKAPRNIAVHRRFFRCHVQFEHDCNAIVFPAVDLNAPLAMSDAMLARYAHRYLDSMMEHRSASASEKVRELIRLSLSSGRCSTDSVAGGLGVDRRTVHRYLSETGETFLSVLTEVRTEMATSLLQGRRSICDIATMVGFSGTAAFSRWFTQTFGCSPSVWRDSHDPRRPEPVRRKRPFHTSYEEKPNSARYVLKGRV